MIEAREAFAAQQAELDPLKLIFIDESGSHPGIGPRRGWAPCGAKLTGPEQAYARGQHVSMIGALRLDGISALMTVKGGVKQADYLRFVVERLVPTLRPGDVVVCDNLNLHKHKDVIAAIEAVGAKILLLPKYSPDLNPIEAAWAKVKHRLRRMCPSTVTELREAMRRALRAIRPKDAAGWFEYCGYPLPCF